MMAISGRARPRSRRHQPGKSSLDYQWADTRLDIFDGLDECTRYRVRRQADEASYGHGRAIAA